MAHAIGIDIGTTNTKVALVDEDGTVVATAHRGIATRREGDAAEQGPDELWGAVAEAVHEVTSAAPGPAARVAAVGVCSQYSSTIPVDADGRATAPMLLWTDRRGTDHCFAIMESHPEAFEVWIERHGIPTVGSGLSLGHILHIQHDQPEVHAATAAYLEPMDFVNMRLTGEIAATQCTMLTTQLCDNRTLGATTYDDDLVAMSCVDATKLPPLVAADATVGALRPDVAAELGMPAGIPVQAGMNDSHAGAYATGAFDDGRAGLAIGTTAVLLDAVDAMAVDLDHEVLSCPSPEPGRYLVWAENGLAGKAVEHVLEHIVHASDELGDHSVADRFAALEEALAAGRPGAGGLLFLPWLGGSLSPAADGAVRGGFLNMSLDTRRTDLVRSVVEGTAHNLAWLLPYVEAFTGRPAGEIAFAGGAARSAQWAGILADVLDRPILPVADPDHAAARAVALVALRRAGGVADAASPAAPTVARHEPTAANRTGYAKAQAQFEAAFDALRPLHHALND